MLAPPTPIIYAGRGGGESRRKEAENKIRYRVWNLGGGSLGNMRRRWGRGRGVGLKGVPCSLERPGLGLPPWSGEGGWGGVATNRC